MKPHPRDFLRDFKAKLHPRELKAKLIKWWRSDGGIIMDILGVSGSTIFAFFMDLFKATEKWFAYGILIVFFILFHRLKRNLSGLQQLLLWLVVILNLAIVAVVKAGILETLVIEHMGDWRYAIPRKASDPKDIVIVMIDRETQERFGSDMLSYRKYHGELLRRISQAHPKVVGFDLFFSGESKDDSVFATAIRQSFCHVVLAKHYNDLSGAHEPISTTLVRALRDKAGTGDLSFQIGHTRLGKDDDHVVRKVNLVTHKGEHHFALSVWLSAASGRLARANRAELRVQLSDASPAKIPLNREGELYINYTKAKFFTLPYNQILSANSKVSAFTDKIVLIGAEDDRDVSSVPDFPSLGTMYGVEIMANAVATLMSGHYIKKPPDVAYLFFVLICLWINLHGFVRLGSSANIVKLKPVPYIWEAGAMLLLIIAAQLLWNWWFDFFYLLFTLVSTYTALRVLNRFF